MCAFPDRILSFGKLRRIYPFVALRIRGWRSGVFPGQRQPQFRNVGELRLSMTARIVLNDGQHRRAAIEEALKARPKLENETISVVLFVDEGLERCQQMFADLNKNAVRPSGSLNVLYDRRNPLARLSTRVLEGIPFFQEFIELEKRHFQTEPKSSSPCPA